MGEKDSGCPAKHQAIHAMWGQKTREKRAGKTQKRPVTGCGLCEASLFTKVLLLDVWVVLGIDRDQLLVGRGRMNCVWVRALRWEKR